MPTKYVPVSKRRNKNHKPEDLVYKALRIVYSELSKIEDIAFDPKRNELLTKETTFLMNDMIKVCLLIMKERRATPEDTYEGSTLEELKKKAAKVAKEK